MKPSRQELVLAVFRVLMEAFGSLNIPVVIAFDQLEDLLLARRTDDGHRIAESFFAGLVQAMHQLDGICFLDLRRARPVEPLRAVARRLHSGSAQQSGACAGARHGQGDAARSAAAGAGAPRGRGAHAASRSRASLRRASDSGAMPIGVSRSPRNRSSRSPAPSRPCATCSSNFASCSIISSTASCRRRRMTPMP